MAEHRKPSFTILLKNEGKNKSTKVELFKKSLWEKCSFGRSHQYRIRISGKWFDKKKGYKGKKYFNKWEFRDLLWRSLNL